MYNGLRRLVAGHATKTSRWRQMATLVSASHIGAHWGFIHCILLFSFIMQDLLSIWAKIRVESVVMVLDLTSWRIVFALSSPTCIKYCIWLKFTCLCIMNICVNLGRLFDCEYIPSKWCEMFAGTISASSEMFWVCPVWLFVSDVPSMNLASMITSYSKLHISISLVVYILRIWRYQNLIVSLDGHFTDDSTTISSIVEWLCECIQPECGIFLCRFSPQPRFL